MTESTLARARAAKQALLERIKLMPELRGVGITRLPGGGFGVKVNVASLPSSCEIPDDIDGVPVIVDVVGRITAS
jgi:hypothetical protein